MLIAHVRFPVAPEHRQTVLDAFRADLAGVRAMSGCRAFFPFFDIADDAMFGIVHEWDSEEDFQAYTASGAFAAFGRRVRPLMTGAPDSRRFLAELIEGPN